MSALLSHLEALLSPSGSTESRVARSRTAAAFWPEFMRCQLHGNIMQSSDETLLLLRNAGMGAISTYYHDVCRCDPSGGPALAGAFRAPASVDRHQPTLESLHEVRDAWKKANDELQREVAREERRSHSSQSIRTHMRQLRTDELAAWIAYLVTAVDVVRPLVVAAYSAGAESHPLAAYLSECEDSSRARRPPAAAGNQSEGSITRGWCAQHKRIGDLLPVGPRRLYEPCFMCPKPEGPTTDDYITPQPGPSGSTQLHISSSQYMALMKDVY